jgi:hypothetical protein
MQTNFKAKILRSEDTTPKEDEDYSSQSNLISISYVFYKKSREMCVIILHSSGRWDWHLIFCQWTTCEIPRDDLFSEDFDFKINTLVTNLAHILLFSEDH